jgi:hypothetical protein
MPCDRSPVGVRSGAMLFNADYRSEIFPERHDQHNRASKDADSEQSRYEPQ